jgi:hypothetical protein
MVMPAWEGEPRVAAHVMDRHANLSARADGLPGSGLPPRRWAGRVRAASTEVALDQGAAPSRA